MQPDDGVPYSAGAEPWAQRAARRVEARVAGHPHWKSPLDRGLLLTARTDYRERQLSSAFTVSIVDAAGSRRRVASASGAGRPLMILPGLYAALTEGLFAVVAELAARTGRPVLLVEDRLAAGTLALSGGDVPSLARLGQEVAALASGCDSTPDLLAFSGGAAAGLAAPPGTFERIAVWSGALDLWATADNLTRHALARWHYSQVHRRAFTAARLAVPPLQTVPARLVAGAPCGLPPGPLLIVHAEDDPVVPAATVRDLPLEEGQCVTVLASGAHLGFGTLVGPDVYLLPFEEETAGP